MDTKPLVELDPDERRMLQIFARHGRDGRAITVTSLAAHAEFGEDRARLAAALRRLVARGLIKEGGDNPFVGAPVAFRLAKPLPRPRPSERPPPPANPEAANALLQPPRERPRRRRMDKA